MFERGCTEITDPALFTCKDINKNGQVTFFFDNPKVWYFAFRIFTTATAMVMNVMQIGIQPMTGQMTLGKFH